MLIAAVYGAIRQARLVNNRAINIFLSDSSHAHKSPGAGCELGSGRPQKKRLAEDTWDGSV